MTSQNQQFDFDLVVIGGGIQGAGVARDAALRGLRVLLCEKGDFGSATSANSSKLVHGGLRYLERMDIGLVYEALRERATLLRNARHLVRPQRFIVPFMSGARRSAWMFRLGLWLYDLMAGRQPLPKRRRLSRKEVIDRLALLHPQRLQGGIAYSDCQMNDARLVLANIVDACRAGAQCFNYAAVTAVQPIETSAGGRGYVVTYTHEERQYSVRCATVVNAAGPWVDAVNGIIDPQSAPQLTHAKGVHLLFDGGPPMDDAILLEVPDEKRIFFMIPWAGRLLVGTTDTSYSGPLDRLEVDEADLHYLCRSVAAYVRGATLEKLVPVGVFAGVRPLTFVSGSDTRDISRHYRILEIAPGVWAVVGGKYTVYRKIAEQVVDRVAACVGGGKRCSTEETVISGNPPTRWDEFERLESQTCHVKFMVPIQTALHLVRTYGEQWREVMMPTIADSSLLARLSPSHPHIEAEVVYAVMQEKAQHLSDFFMRRTTMFFSEDAGCDALVRVRKIFGKLLQLNEEVLDRQQEEYLRVVAQRDAQTRAVIRMLDEHMATSRSA